MRRFLQDPLPDEGELLLGEASSHHLLQVAKLSRDSELGLFDGNGREATAVLLGAQDGRALVRIVGPVRRAQPERQVHLILAVLKGDAMAHALRMATEAGVSSVWPVLTQRTIPKGDKGDRWRRIVQSAAQQCGRADLPEVFPVRSLAQQLEQLPSVDQHFVAAPGAEPSDVQGQTVAVAIGPEGGWTDQELQMFDAEGWQPLGLGRWVLRADTATAIAVHRLA